MKDIKGYEGLYAITEEGKIWNHRTQRFMSTRIHHSTGYQIINLAKDGKKKTLLVHRLVAEAYLPNPDNLEVVHHKNAIRSDCRLSNLMWVSQEVNMIFKNVDYLRSLGFTVEIPENFNFNMRGKTK